MKMRKNVVNSILSLLVVTFIVTGSGPPIGALPIHPPVVETI